MAAPNWQANGTQVQGTGDLAPPWPATHAIDDVALMGIGSANEPPTLSDPQGFVQLVAVGIGTAGAAGSTRITVFWCRATSTTMATPTIQAPGNHAIARILTVRGCVNSGVPVDIMVSNTLGTPDTAFTIPGGTTTLADDLIALFIANAIDSAAAQATFDANADLSGLTERTDSNTSAGVGGGFATAFGSKATAGAFAASTGTLLAASNQARLAIALRSLDFPAGSAQAARGMDHMRRRRVA